MKIGIKTGKQIRDEMNEYANIYDNHEWDNIFFIPVGEIGDFFQEKIMEACSKVKVKGK